MSDEKTKSNLGVHFFYVALILISIIILLGTAKWTELPKFTEYLSTAATITSLVLGLLAIIYAFISNDALSQTTGMVAGVANEAQEATLKISQLLETVSGLSAGTNESNETMSRLVEELKVQMNSLAGTTSTLDNTANAIAEILPEIPKGLSLLGERIDKFTQAAPIAPNTNNEVKTSEEEVELIAKHVLDNASTWGLLVLHACYLSQKSGKSVTLKNIISDGSSGDYFFGYFVALASTRILEYTRKDGNINTVTIKKCPAAFIRAKEIYLVRCNELDDEVNKKLWEEHIITLENTLA